VIPMSSPDLGSSEIDAALGVLRTPHLSGGPQIEAFERAVADRVGMPCATGVSSGTAGLHLSVISCGITEGDLVLTTPLSFVASTNCILYERAIPVFVDVDPATGNIDPRAVAEAAEALSEMTPESLRFLPPSCRNGHPAGRLKAILPVHLYGVPCDMDPILDTASRHGLTVIEDACEAIGSEYKGRAAGSLGDVAVFAFYPNKQMTTGEGGMILTRSKDRHDLLISLRNQGRDSARPSLDHARLGYNYRLGEMSAALGVAQLRRLDELLDKRRRVANWYSERLSDITSIGPLRMDGHTTRMSWFVYVVRIRPPADRDRVIAALEQESIPSRPYFPPIHLQPYIARRFGYDAGAFPIAEALGRESLALPFSGVMTEDQVDRVCRELIRAVRMAGDSAGYERAPSA